VTKPDWIAIDWGTTHLRAWGMTSSGTVLQTAQSDRGMGTLARDQFEGALFDLIGDWGCSGPMIACGMVGSRQGWVEAPYATTPCPPLGNGLAKAPGTRMDVHVISGIKQLQPADVMRGEETQIAGFLSLNPKWDGVICLPGTHTKWVHVSADEVISFQTFMTGEMFALLSGQSVLRHSIGDGWDDAAFATAVSDAMSKPEAMAARLFNLRANELVNGQCRDAARARLSGLLIGAELAAARPYWLGQSVAVLGAGGLAKIYTAALTAQGVPVTQTDGDRATLAGLTAAYRRMKAAT
jgi:2-dehydro-3-deoxygalactonokinase